LKHPDATLATYKRRQIKYLKHVSEKLEKKTLEKPLQVYVTSR
jgi:predicted type IV restriction endonuclease